MYATMATVAGIVAAILFLPLPYHVYTTLEVRPRDPLSIYVDVPGELQAVHVKDGQTVAAGAPLADLKSLDVELSIVQLRAKADELRTQLEALQRQRHDDRESELQIPSIQKALRAVEEQIDDKMREKSRMRLVSSRAGIVVSPPSVPQQPSPDGKLPHWHGTPLEPRNLGATLVPGTLFCQIGEPGQFDAVLVIDQADIESIWPGQKVKIMLDQMPGDMLRSEIVEVLIEDLKVAPRALSAKHKGELVTRTDPSGIERPASTSYQARAPLDDLDGLLAAGLKGQAKIDAGYHSLGWRFWRFLTRTFHFQLT
jgi:putative peptide zinc metalloprotease protein